MSINDAKTMEEYEAVTVTWPLNAARAFEDVAKKSGKPFKFVYVSGMQSFIRYTDRKGKVSAYD